MPLVTPVGSSRRWAVRRAPARSNPASAGHNDPKDGRVRPSLRLRFHCTASVESSLILSFLASSYRAATSRVLPSTCSLPMRPLPGVLLAVLDTTVSSGHVVLLFNPLASAVLCRLPAPGCPQTPCPALVFWISLAVRYFSELTLRSFTSFYSVLFILASCSVRMMLCFGTKSFKRKCNQGKLPLWICFLLSVKQTGLVCSPVVTTVTLG